MAAAGSSACDTGSPHDEAHRGPGIRIVARNVGADRVIPADGAIQIAFDRYLLPATILRQSYSVLDGNNQPIANSSLLQTIYDPVARTVTITGGGGRWLEPNQLYSFVLGIPEGDGDLGGFRAIDRATLDPNQPRAFRFVAGPEAGQTALDPSVDFCADVLPLFNAKCAGSTCHGSNARAASGLILTTTAGVVNTVIERLALGANTGARSRYEEPSRRVFGINMPLVTPGDPASSWLLYKVDLAPPPPRSTLAPPTFTCTPPAGESPVLETAEDYVPLLPEATTPASDAERAVLNDFVLGREMPYPLADAKDYPYLPLTFQERERIRIWIARGAPTRECGGCGRLPDE